MGCNKSKIQHRRSETHVHEEHLNQVELGQDANFLHNRNLELNQNWNSNFGYETDNAHSSQLSSNQFRNNFLCQTGYRYSEANITGAFGDTTSEYNGFNRRCFGVNEYNNSNMRSSSLSINSTCNNFSQEQFQDTYIQNQFQGKASFIQEHMGGPVNGGSVMGPPSRPISRQSRRNHNASRTLKPLVRRRSFNDDCRRAVKNTHCSSMVRHGSLENISSRSRIRNLRNNHTSENNLFWKSNSSKEEYSRDFNLKWRNSRSKNQQRGLKRNSWDEVSLHSNSTSSDNSGSTVESVNMPEEGPRVKRRPSDIDEPSSTSTDVSNDDRKEDEEENKCNDENKAMQKNVEQLSLCDEIFDILDLLMFPDEWSSCAFENTCLVDISLSSLEGRAVQKYFSRSSITKDFRLSITAIARIENPFMHSYYLLKKEEMESRNQHVDELYLYHGTKKEHLSGILEDNLNWRLYSDQHRFGQGVSFSPLATYSSHYSDKSHDKVMLLLKVLASNSVGGSPDMKVPPIIDNIVYDASIKDDTTVVVKYSDNEFYPLYKINYMKIMRN